MFKKTALTRIFFILFFSGSVFFQTFMVHAQEFSGDTVTDMHTGSVNGKIYFKNTQMNRNDMMGMITIVNYPDVYQLFKGTKKYHVTTVTELETDDPMAGVTDFEAWAKQNDFKKTGTESIEEFACDIYEGTIEIDQDTGEKVPLKIWLSSKLEYPLKTETLMPQPVGRVLSVVKNIKTGKQPAHLFEIPEGYTQAPTMEQAMGMPDMSQFSEGQMPTGEQMENMMKQVQEMMKNMQQQ